MRLTTKLCISLVIWMFCLSCDDGILRGYLEKSSDGETYLVIEDDNGGACGPILVDSKEWPHAIGEPGLIGAGIHRIECGGEMEFSIESGAVFHFDYWGP